jgi:Uncharacterized conserved protein
MRLDEEYRSWIQELGKRYRTSQIKASIRVNNEMLMYYWSVGKDITERRADSKWGNKFFQNMSMDMADMIPNVKGFSPTNLRYMMRFYVLFKDIEIVPQLGEQFLDNNGNKIVPQVEERFEMAANKVFMIPWGHIKVLIDKCHDNPEKFHFYIDKVIENNWSRAVLLNFLDTDLFERQGQAITNFKYTLPKESGDLAQEITKDPYNFDFVAIRQGYNEKELKDALMDNVQNFLMELGTGFAFVGREYRLQVGNTEQFEAPFDVRFRDYMVETVKYLMGCGFRIVYGFTQSDEISLLFHAKDNTFGRKVRKINSTLAGEASAVFSLKLGQAATFDCRVIPLPNIERVADYFIWRQEDAHRNSLNAHCYWALRKEGIGQGQATEMLEGKSVAFKNELLFQKGINYNELPNWQKRGIGVYFKDSIKEGYNPVTKETVQTTRRELTVDYELTLGREYGEWVAAFADTE